MTLGIFLGMAADRMFGDPPTAVHPVALFGRAATKLEKVFYRDSKLAGALYLTAAVVPPVVATYWLEKRYPTATMTLALFSALGGTTLERIGERMARMPPPQPFSGPPAAPRGWCCTAWSIPWMPWWATGPRGTRISGGRQPPLMTC